ncbi:MAG TPA: hypothetical protein VET48_08505 [Steroidobacteraceae bacterium]|nr:hypothetical protein [Steroidobacteraceae bacterium]
MKSKIRNRRTPDSFDQRPLLRLVDVIDTVSKFAATTQEAARVINHMLSERHISFATDFDARRLRTIH